MFKLNPYVFYRQYTPSLLVMFAVLISARQFMGDPIHCWCPEQVSYFTILSMNHPCKAHTRAFRINTNLTFLYKIDIKGFWKVLAKKLIASSGNRTHN